MLRILDRYIIRSVILPILFCAYTLILLFLISDVFDHITEILENKTSFSVIVKYYLCLTPFAYSQIISWATFLGIIYLFTNLNKNYELIAMKASGLQFSFYFKPLIFLGFAISIFTFIINDRIVPETFRIAEEIKNTQIKKTSEEVVPEKVRNIAMLKRNKQIYVKEMDTNTFSLNDIRLHYLDDNFDVTKKIVAKNGIWVDNHWQFSIVSVYELGPGKQIIGEPVFIPKFIVDDLDIIPEELINAGRDLKEKSLNEVRGLIEDFKENGLDYREELVELYQKALLPWMNLVIVLIILPIMGRSQIRKGMATTVILCLLLVFSYHLVNAIILAIGKSGFIPPFLSALIPHLIFATIGIILIKKANY